MFSEKDKAIISRDFFEIIYMGDAIAELRSENEDYWMIMEVQQWLSRRQRASQTIPTVFYRVMHRHADSESFHEHIECINVLDCVLEILQHDDFRLKRRGKTHFDELLEEVGIA